MPRGFSLLELVITLFISSLLSLLLFNVLNQSTVLLRRIESITATDIPVITCYDRLERDITGAFIPSIGDPDTGDKAFAKQLKEAEEQEEKQQEEQKKQEAKKITQPKTPVKQVSLQDIQVKKVFVYEEKNNNLSLFTFITCNPAIGYHQVKPRMARVLYTLTYERDSKTYTLKRTESEKLGLKSAESDGRQYTLLRNIVSLRFEFLAPKTEEKKEQFSQETQNKSENQQTAPPLVTYTSWPIKISSEGTDKENKKIGQDLPQFVKILLTFREPVDQGEKKYEFLFPIFYFRAPSKSLLNTPLIHLKREDQKKQLAEQATKESAATITQMPGT